jgi:hypothetical protein
MDGTKLLLRETCTILNKIDAEYIIVGGWTPFLLNTSKYAHPGTKDVDVLFRDGYVKGSLRDVFSAFFDAGFSPSAKHPFQVLKPYKIGAQSFTFNVDILHPSESLKDPDLFVDHFDFGFRTLIGSDGNLHARSIVLPSADILFNGFSDTIELSVYLNDGGPPLKANLMNLIGLIATKSESFLNTKRQRDAFDLFLAYNQGDLDITSSLEALYASAGGASDVSKFVDMLHCFSNNILHEWHRFNSNVSKFAKVDVSDPAAFVVERHNKLVNEVVKFCSSLPEYTGRSAVLSNPYALVVDDTIPKLR